MSSKPHPEGVTKVIDLLTAVERLEHEEQVLRPKAQRYDAVISELRKARSELPELLRSMDVHEPGHTGWEGRFGWFLAKMRRQLRKEFAPPPELVEEPMRGR